MTNASNDPVDKQDHPFAEGEKQTPAEELAEEVQEYTVDRIVR